MAATILATLLMLQSITAASPPAAPPYAVPGEDAVDPYAAADSNAGAKPFTGDAMAHAFHGPDGIGRIADTFADLNYADPVIGEIFEGHDRARFTRTLYEQFCYILNAGCSYSGRDMMAAHRDLGIQHGDMNKLVENLQRAMVKEGVSFQAQNRFLAKLAPMSKQIIER